MLDVVVTKEVNGRKKSRVVFKCETVKQAEDWINNKAKTDPKGVANAFGSYDVSRMTSQKVTAQDIRTDYRRTKLCFNLLEAHKATMKKLVGHGLIQSDLSRIVESADKVRATLTRQFGKEWARWERRGKVL